MYEFEEFIIKKYPNRSPKVLLQKFQDADGTWFYGVKEVQDQSESWQARQAEVDEKDKRIEKLEWALKFKTRHSDFYENSRKAHRALSRYRKQKIDELRKHSISLRDAAKSWSYTEREKNILISQADDIDRILSDEKALRGERE